MILYVYFNGLIFKDLVFINQHGILPANHANISLKGFCQNVYVYFSGSDGAE